MEYSRIHGAVFQEAQASPCTASTGPQLAECVKGLVERHGFAVSSVELLDINTQPTDDLSAARFVRVEARMGAGDERHVFTFAVVRMGDEYRAMWLQSAVIVP